MFAPAATAECTHKHPNSQIISDKGVIVEGEQIVQRGAIERLDCACNEYTTNNLPFNLL